MTQYYDELSFIADDIVKQKYKMKQEYDINCFKESVSLDQRITKKLFNGNNPKLISLLYFDAYKLFYKSEADIEAIPPYGDSYPEFVDLAVLGEVGTLDVTGWITKKHYDSDAAAGHSYSEEYNYYGCLSVNYVDEYMRNIKKDYTFEQNLLQSRVSIDKHVYDVLVMADENNDLSYSVFRRIKGENVLLFVSNSANLKEDIENYVSNSGNTEIRTLFPQVYKSIYFKDYSGPVRVR